MCNKRLSVSINKTCALLLAVFTTVLAIFVNQILCFEMASGRVHSESTFSQSGVCNSLNTQDQRSSAISSSGYESIVLKSTRYCKDLVLHFDAKFESKQSFKLIHSQLIYGVIFASLFSGKVKNLPLPVASLVRWTHAELNWSNQIFNPLSVRLLI